jgi:hypothetical protein
MSDEKYEEMLEKVNRIKHNFKEFVPTMMEMMFDACMGIIYEDYAKEIADLEMRQHNSPGIQLGLLKAAQEEKMKKERALILYLKDRLAFMYRESGNEPKKNKK